MENSLAMLPNEMAEKIMSISKDSILYTVKDGKIFLFSSDDSSRDMYDFDEENY